MKLFEECSVEGTSVEVCVNSAPRGCAVGEEGPGGCRALARDVPSASPEEPHWIKLGLGRAGTQFHGFLSGMKATSSRQDPLKCLVVCLPDECSV